MVGARRALLSVCVAIQIALGLAGTASANVSAPPPLRWPLGGELVEGFTAKDRYGPGHRGLDIASADRGLVRASHDGVVTFAGTIAGVRSVTVTHSSGWLTSYSFLATVAVTEGVEVGRGEVLGTAGKLHGSDGSGIHFSLRHGDEYVDPLPFMIGSRPVLLPPPSDTRSTGSGTLSPAGPSKTRRIVEGCSVSLIDCSGPVGELFRRSASFSSAVLQRATELGRAFVQQVAIVTDWAMRAEQAAARALRLAIRKTSQELAGVIAGLASLPLAASAQAALMIEPLAPDTAKRVRNRGRRLARLIESTSRRQMQLLVDEALEPADIAVALREEASALSRYETERMRRATDCLSADRLSEESRSPAAGVVYVVVSGLGSSYEPGSESSGLVQALKMRNKEVVQFSYRGLVANQSGHLEPSPYMPEDTYKDIRISAGLLLDQLAALSRAAPDKKIVVVAHSQGGVVARYALAKLYPGRSAEIPPVAALVTIASPHRGSGGAADLVRASKSEIGRDVVAALDGSDARTADAESVRQLAWGSDFMREAGTKAPEGIPTTSISASTDMIVPAHETLVDGAANIIVDTSADGIDAHSRVVENPQTQLAIEAAVRGGSLCQSPEEVVRAASIAAITTVGVERSRDTLADSFEVGGR